MKVRLFTSHLLFLGIIALSSSCATLMNKSYSEITVRSEQPLNYIVQGDTVMNPSGEDFTFIMPNKPEPLDFRIFNDEVNRRMPILAEKSPWYWGNVIFLPVYIVGAPLGALTDELTGKKWTYPSRVFIDLEKTQYGYRNYYPMDPSFLAYKNRISITPLSSVELYHPGIEFSYLLHHNPESATQLTYSHLLARDNEFSRDAEGFELGLEHKIYLKNSTRTRIYTSVSLDYLRKDHRAETTLLIPEDNEPRWQWDRFRRLVDIEKRFINVTPRFGVEYYLSRSLIFEAFAGAGVRFRDVSLPGIDPDIVAENDGWFWDTVQDSNSPGRRLSLNIDANFRIGFQF